MAHTRLNQIPEKDEFGPKPHPSNLNKRQLKALSVSSHFWLQTAKRGFYIVSFTLLLVAFFWPFVNRQDYDHDEIQRLNNAAPQKEMIAPVFQGQDENHKPFVLTAEKSIVLENEPNADLDNSTILLDFPKGEFLNEKNEKVLIDSEKGTYLPNIKILKLNQNVHIVTEDGHDFRTESAIIDLKDSSAQGNEPVKGFGPQGNIQAQGFRMTNKGAKVVFIGNSQSQLYQKSGMVSD